MLWLQRPFPSGNVLHLPLLLREANVVINVVINPQRFKCPTINCSFELEAKTTKEQLEYLVDQTIAIHTSDAVPLFEE